MVNMNAVQWIRELFDLVKFRYQAIFVDFFFHHLPDHKLAMYLVSYPEAVLLTNWLAVITRGYGVPPYAAVRHFNRMGQCKKDVTPVR